MTEATVSILEQARIKRVQAEYARRMARSAYTPADVNAELVRKAEKLEEIARDLERRAGLADGRPDGLADTPVSREAD